jgi:hypothetical protein
MPKALEAHEVLVRDLFSNKYRFTIPAYQRPYSWLPEHAGQLFDDIREPALTGGDFANLKPYFIGSMVLVKQTDDPPSDVIDGQQRLTTLTILLSVLRHVSSVRGIQTQGQELAPSLNQFIYEAGNVAAGIPASHRLTIREPDQHFFFHYIQQPGGIANLQARQVLPDSQKRIAENARILMARLDQLSSEQVAQFVKYLLQKIYVAVVQTIDEDAAFRIFGVLNDRGLRLSTADILKAEIIGAMPQENRNRYSKKWDDAEEALGTDRFDDLFAHIRMIRVRRKASLSTVKEIREFIGPKKAPREFVDDLLLPLAEIMEEVENGTVRVATYNVEINEIIDWLKQLMAISYAGHSDWVPVALECVRRSRDDPGPLLDALRLLERLTFGFLVLHKSSSERIERYGTILKEMDAASPSKCPSLELSSQERSEIVRGLEADVYEEYYCRYLLKRLDRWRAGEGAKYGSSKVVTIEHVLPQNPDPESEWMNAYPDEAERVFVLNKLGNLTLLHGRRNTAAGNRDFREKIEKYFKPKQGHFVLTAELVQKFQQWTPKEFYERQDVLLAACKEIWAL